MALPVFSTGDVPSATQVNQWFVNTIFKQKSANENIGVTTLQNDDDLFFTAEANTIYHVTLGLFVAAQTAQDAKIDFSLPAGASFHYSISTQTTGSAAYSDDQIFPQLAGTSSGIGGLGGAGNSVAHIEGIFKCVGTAGTFQLTWAQIVAGSATSMLADSWLLARRVG